MHLIFQVSDYHKYLRRAGGQAGLPIFGLFRVFSARLPTLRTIKLSEKERLLILVCFNRRHWLPTIKPRSQILERDVMFQPPTLATYYQTLDQKIPFYFQ